MQPHIWYYCIIGTIQSHDLERVFSLHCIARYYWVNWLKIAINSAPKYGDMSETNKYPNSY